MGELLFRIAGYLAFTPVAILLLCGWFYGAKEIATLAREAWEDGEWVAVAANACCASMWLGMGIGGTCLAWALFQP